MKKKLGCFFLMVSFFSIMLVGNALEVEKKQKLSDMTEESLAEEVNVKLDFNKQTVTTKTLPTLLENQGLLKKLTVKNQFPYLDTAMEDVFEQIYDRDLPTYELLFEEKLESYGFFEESEKVKRTGLVLESVEVRIPKFLLLSIKKKGRIQIEIL